MCIGTHVHARSPRAPANCNCKMLSYPLIGYDTGTADQWPYTASTYLINHAIAWHVGHSVIDVRALDDMERTTKVVACRVLHRKAVTPGNHMWDPHAATERDGKAIASPLTGYMRNTDSKCFSTLYFFLSMTQLTAYATL
jgi:hypothetical protein